MLKFVKTHPAYNGDLVVNQNIAFDLMIACKEIGEGSSREGAHLTTLNINPLSAAVRDTHTAPKSFHQFQFEYPGQRLL